MGSKFVYNIVPPLGLGYLANSLQKINIEVEILNCILKNFSYDNFAKYISSKKFDVVGLQFFTNEYSSVKKCSEIIKLIEPKTLVMVGGPHPSSLPEEVLVDFKNVDFAFWGEGEVGFFELVNQILNNKNNFEKIPGLIYRDNGKIKVNKQIFIDDLDEIGFPSWDLLQPDKYPPAPQGTFFKNFPTAPMITSRGCPYNCTFCAGWRINGKKIRYRSVTNVIEEIVLLNKKYGVKEIHISDDNFTFNKNFVISFCEALLKNNINISWCCPNGIRLDTLDEEMLDIMKRAGCYVLSVGIESGSQRILDKMKKKLTLNKIREKISLIRKVGFDINGFFIIGYPEENIEDIEKSINFAKNLDLKSVIFYNFLPLPGTKIYQELKMKGEISKVDWDKYFQSDVPYSPRGVTKKDIKKYQRKAHFKFYFRWKIIYRMIKDIKTFSQIKFIINRILRYYF